MMILQIILSLVLVILSCFLMGQLCDRTIKRFNATARRAFGLFPRQARPTLMGFYATLFTTAQIIVALIWALFYKFVAGAGENDATFESAFYFALTNQSLLGYGDMTLNESWRILSTIQGLSSFVCWLLAAACLFEIFKRLYRNQQKSS
jgi:hypothetical protein